MATTTTHTPATMNALIARLEARKEAIYRKGGAVEATRTTPSGLTIHGWDTSGMDADNKCRLHNVTGDLNNARRFAKTADRLGHLPVLAAHAVDTIATRLDDGIFY